VVPPEYVDARQHQRAGSDPLIVPENVVLMVSLPVVSVVAQPHAASPASEPMVWLNMLTARVAPEATVIRCSVRSEDVQGSGLLRAGIHRRRAQIGAPARDRERAGADLGQAAGATD
jgi:hypothetical protein